jgi:hypothetical protein
VEMLCPMLGAAAVAAALGGLWVLGYGMSHRKALITLLEALLYDRRQARASI